MTSNTTALKALARAKAGKGAARATRRTGQVPAVIYGDNKETVLISILEKDLIKVNASSAFFTKLCNLDVEGKSFTVIPRDVQLDFVTDRPIHADFLRVNDKTIVRVFVPVRVTNQKDCPGLAKGGVLNLVRHEVEVSCRAGEIPESFTLDLAGLDVGTSLHIEDLKLPASVKPVMPGNFTVATIVAPSAMKSEAEAAAATTASADAAAPAAAAPAAAAPAKDAGKDAKAKK